MPSRTETALLPLVGTLFLLVGMLSSPVGTLSALSPSRMKTPLE